MQRWLDAGRLDETEAGAQRLLGTDPNNEAALCALGMVYMHRQQFAQAREQFYIASALHPDSLDALCGLGMAAQTLHNFSEAHMAYRQALALAPDEPELHRLLAIVLAALGRVDEALKAQQRFEKLTSPDRQRAILSASETPAHVPHSQTETWQAINSQGKRLIDAQHYAEAERLLQKALAQFPNVAQIHNNLSVALMFQMRMPEAVEQARRAVVLAPEAAFPYSNLANALLYLPDLSGAEQAQRHALHIDPELPRALITLAILLRKQGRLAEFEATVKQALAKHEQEASFMWARHLLRERRFAEGWEAYETRPSKSKRTFTLPEWDGSPLDGRTVLVHAEQGFGDTLQMARLLPLVKAQGGQVMFECQEELGELMESAAGWGALLLSRGHIPLQDARYDVHVFLMSLPYLLHVNTEMQMQTSVPYLSVKPQRLEAWKAKFAMDDTAFRVGLVWACGNRSPADLLRSASLDLFAPLLDIPGVQFYSLQKGLGEQELTAYRGGRPLINIAPDLNDFSDTAAAMMHLDLVITVDTSTAHLAGALGRPVWTLLQFDSDWRWQREREDSPWYPTMRLFRQQKEGDWSPVCERVRKELMQHLADQQSPF